MVSTGEGIGRGKFCTGEDFPDNIKVAKSGTSELVSEKVCGGL